MPRPVSIVRGKIRIGSCVSSTMLTESSKPTIEKNAMAVAMVTAMNRPLSSGFSKTVTRPRSPSPRPITQTPIPITMASAVISTMVSTTLNFTLSPTPRRLIAASTSMKASAVTSVAPELGSSLPKPIRRFAASRFDDVEALVMPEHTTVNATRKVMKWMPNALCV